MNNFEPAELALARVVILDVFKNDELERCKCLIPGVEGIHIIPSKSLMKRERGKHENN